MIHYDGIGADKSGIHTEERFLEIMKHEFEYKKWKDNCIYENAIQLNFKDWVLPDDFWFFTLDDWIDYSGAVRH